MTDKELMAYRDEKETEFRLRTKIVREAYLTVARLLENSNERFRVETPFGTAEFFPKANQPN